MAGARYIPGSVLPEDYEPPAPDKAPQFFLKCLGCGTRWPNDVVFDKATATCCKKPKISRFKA